MKSLPDNEKDEADLLSAIAGLRDGKTPGDAAKKLPSGIFPISEGIAAEAEKVEGKKAGDRMPDGSIYLGFFGNKDWFVAAEDAKDKNGGNLAIDYNKAAAYAKNLRAHGHDDWRMPPGKDDPNEPNILNEMFNNKSAGGFKGTYDESGYPFYRSSTLITAYPELTFELEFGRGNYGSGLKGNHCSVRCVRSAPRQA